MAYAIRFPVRFAQGLEKTWSTDKLLIGNSSLDYFDVHCSLIEQYEPLKDIFDIFLEKGNFVLEAGCGSCRWVNYLNRQGYRCIGLDIDEQISATASTLDPGMKISVGSVFSLPFKSGTFDAVLSSYVLEHFKGGPVLALKEAKRVLKPGGLLFFVVPFNNLLRVILFNRLLDLACYYYAGGKGKLAFHEYRYSRKECRHFLLEAGFEPVGFFSDEGLADWNKGVTADYRNLQFFWPRMPNLPEEYKLPRWARWLISVLLKVYPWSCCEGLICVAENKKYGGKGRMKK